MKESTMRGGNVPKDNSLSASGSAASARENVHYLRGAPHAVPQEAGAEQGLQVTQPALLHLAQAQLPVLPEPLRLLHGPLLLVLKWWRDGTISASLPVCALYGDGETEFSAIADLSDTILEWASGIVSSGGSDALGGPLLQQWRAFEALVDVSGLK
jgi:hypothetical protein